MVEIFSDIGDKIANNRDLNWREPAPQFHTKVYDNLVQTGESAGAPVFTREDIFKSPKFNTQYYEDIMLYINDIEEGLTTIDEPTIWYAYRKIGANADLPEGAILASNAGPNDEKLIKIPLNLTADPKEGLKFHGADLNFVNYVRDLRDAWSRLATDGCYLLGGLASGVWPFNPFSMDNTSFIEDIEKPPVLAIPFNEEDQKSVGHVQAEFIGDLRQQSWMGYINNDGGFERQEVFTADKDKTRDAQFKITRFVNADGDLQTLDLATILEVPNQYRQDNTVYDQSFNYIYAVEKNGTIHAISKTNTPNVKVDNIQRGVMSRAFIPPRPYDNVFDPSEEGLVYNLISSLPGFSLPTAFGNNTDKIYNYHIPMQIVQSTTVDFGTITGGSYAISNGARMMGQLTNPSGGAILQGRTVVNVFTQHIVSVTTPGGAMLCNGTNEILYTTLGFLEFEDLDVPSTAPATDAEKIAAEQKSFINQSESTLEHLKTFKTPVRHMRTGASVDLEIYDMCQYIGPTIWLDKPRRFRTFGSSDVPYAFQTTGQPSKDETGAASDVSVVDCSRAYRQFESLTRTANYGSLMLMATNKGIMVGIFSDAEFFQTDDPSNLTFTQSIPPGSTPTTENFGDIVEYRTILVCDPDNVIIPGNFRGVAPFQGSTIDDIYKLNLTDSDGNVKVYQLEVENFAISDIQNYLTGWWDNLVRHNPDNLQTTLGFEDGFDFSPGPSISQSEVDDNAEIGVNARKKYHGQFFDDFNINDYTLANGKTNFTPLISNFRGVLQQDLAPFFFFVSNRNFPQLYQTAQMGNLAGSTIFTNDATKTFWDTFAATLGFPAAGGSSFDDTTLFAFTGHRSPIVVGAGGINHQVASLEDVLIQKNLQNPTLGVVSSNLGSSNQIFNRANGNIPWEILTATTSGIISIKNSNITNVGYGRDSFVDNIMVLNNNYTEIEGLFNVQLTFIENLDAFAPNNFVSHPYKRFVAPSRPTWSFVWKQVHDFTPTNGAKAICEPNSNGYFINKPVKVSPSWVTFPQIYEQPFPRSFWLNKTSPKGVKAYRTEEDPSNPEFAGLHDAPYFDDVISIGRKADELSLQRQEDAVTNATNDQIVDWQEQIIEKNEEIVELVASNDDTKTIQESEDIEAAIAVLEAEIAVLESQIAAEQIIQGAIDSAEQHAELGLTEAVSFYNFDGGYITNTMRRATMEIAHRLTKDACSTVRDTNTTYNTFVRRMYYGIQTFDQPFDIDSQFNNDETIGASYMLDVDEELEIEHTGFGSIKWFVSKDTLGRTIDAKNDDVNFLGKNFAIDERLDCVGLIDPDNKEDEDGNAVAPKSTLVTSGTKVILKGLRSGRDRFIYGIDKLGQKAFSMEVFVRGDIAYIAKSRDFNINDDSLALVTSQNTAGERKQYPASKTKRVTFSVAVGSTIDINVITDNCLNIISSVHKAPLFKLIDTSEEPIASIDDGTTLDQNEIDDRYLTAGTPTITKFVVTGISPGTVTLQVATDSAEFDKTSNHGRDFDEIKIKIVANT